jgi:hypothetical protein
LLFDAAGRRMGDGLELDMRLQPEIVDLHALPDTGRPLDAAASLGLVAA